MTHNNWIAVASAEHARRGRDDRTGGYMQVCHGKLAPIKRVLPGDRVAYYAPALTMGGRDGYQSFVSIGIVQLGEPYAFDMGAGFVPYRRDVAYLPAREAPITPLLDAFEFVEDRRRWGYKFRFGLFSVSDNDMRLIAQSMGVAPRDMGY
ncbi:MAG TPA: EVE domain-containing protein [Burkholderiaceae bacterium]|nr:EVE domain-containing protein [Burkholderiaceae bacterium]